MYACSSGSNLLGHHVYVQFSILVDSLCVGTRDARHGRRFHGTLLQQHTTRIRRRGTLFLVIYVDLLTL